MSIADFFFSIRLGFVVPATLLYLAQNSIYDVKGGSRAVIFDRISGVQQTVIGEGTHFLVPWLQKAVLFDVRTRVCISHTVPFFFFASRFETNVVNFCYYC